MLWMILPLCKKIAIILTNGNTENQDDFEANAKKMQDLGVVVIPIALSRKCRYVIESSMMSHWLKNEDLVSIW